MHRPNANATNEKIPFAISSTARAVRANGLELSDAVVSIYLIFRDGAHLRALANAFCNFMPI